MNTLEKLNREYGAQIRGKLGEKKGNEFIRKLAEKTDRVKYSLFGK